jgi:hypothetical protein
VEPDAVPHGKQLKILSGTVVVSMDQRFLPPEPDPGGPPPPEPPDIILRLTVPDGPVAWRLGVAHKDLPLKAYVTTERLEHAVAFEPAPMTLTVDLVRPGAGANGGASTGRTVEARARNAVREPLPEVAGEPGTYRSAARVWTAGFNPLDLLVGNTLVRRIAIDVTRTDTRVTVVDPT